MEDWLMESTKNRTEELIEDVKKGRRDFEFLDGWLFALYWVDVLKLNEVREYLNKAKKENELNENHK